MSGERPWKDPSTSLPPELRAIVDSAKLDEPAPERLEALRAKLTPLTVAPPGFGWARVGMGTLGIAAVIAGIAGWLATHEGQAPEVTAAAPAEVERVESAPADAIEADTIRAEAIEADAIEADAVQAEAIEAAPIEAAARAPAILPGHTPARAPSRGQRASGDDLGEELRLLESARASLERDPAAALRATRAHARRFPNGALAEEREVLAIDAAWRLGERDRARQRAERFLARHGRSAHAEKVRQIVSRP